MPLIGRGAERGDRRRAADPEPGRSSRTRQPTSRGHTRPPRSIRQRADRGRRCAERSSARDDRKRADERSMTGLRGKALTAKRLPFAPAGFEHQRAAVGLRNPPGDRQSEAGALPSARRAATNRSKIRSWSLRRDAMAIVGDADRDTPSRGTRSMVTTPPAARGESHCPAGCRPSAEQRRCRRRT